MLMQAINILRNSYYAEKTDNKFAKVTIVRYLKNQIRYQVLYSSLINSIVFHRSVSVLRHVL